MHRGALRLLIISRHGSIPVCSSHVLASSSRPTLSSPSPHPLAPPSPHPLAASSRLVSSPPSRPPPPDDRRDTRRPHTDTTTSQVELNGDASARYPGCLNYSFAYVEGESLLMALKNIAVSSGSACTSASLEARADSVPHTDWLPFTARVTAPCLARAELRAARDRRRRGARAHLDPLRHR